MVGMSRSCLLLLMLCLSGLAQCQKNQTVEDSEQEKINETLSDIIKSNKSAVDNDTKIADIKTNESNTSSSITNSPSSNNNSGKSAKVWIAGSTECSCIKELTALKRDLRAEITQRQVLQNSLDSYVAELHDLRNVMDDIIPLINDTSNEDDNDADNKSNSSNKSGSNTITKLIAPAINAAAASGHPSVAFSAKLSYNRELKPLDTVIFDTVLTNDGNAYNADTGKFTAVVTGIHMFHSTILSGYNTKVETAIIVNDKEVARIYSGAHDAHGSGSNMAIVDLRTGDSVWVRLLYQGGNHVHGYYSTFSGALLRPADP